MILLGLSPRNVINVDSVTFIDATAREIHFAGGAVLTISPAELEEFQKFMAELIQAQRSAQLAPFLNHAPELPLKRRPQ